VLINSLSALQNYYISHSYVISLLANLNARHYRPTAPSDELRNEDEDEHLPTNHLAPVRIYNDRSANPTTRTSNRILSLIRSVARTTHDDPTRELHRDDPARDSEPHAHYSGDHDEQIRVAGK
jgi:hypothetical protein